MNDFSKDGCVIWPQRLIQELADKRVMIVVGSGLSARATSTRGELSSPPTWKDLVKSLCNSSVRSPKEREVIEQYLSSNNILGAAEHLKKEGDKHSFDSALKDILLAPEFQPSKAHRDIMALDAPVVISLNYDRIYETQCLSGNTGAPSHVVHHYYDEEFVQSLRGRERVILKLHGSVDAPRKAIFSMTDYNEAQKSHRRLFEILEALLLTRTVLFIGCGFNGDPDVEFLLKSTNIKQPDTYPHYAVTPTHDANCGCEKSSEIHMDTKTFHTAIADGLNLEFLHYRRDCRRSISDNHVMFDESLEELKTLVLEERSRSI